MNLLRAFLGISLCSAIACGGPGAYDLCRAECDGIERCGYRNDTQTDTCYSSCSGNQTTYEQEDNALEMMCKNSSDIRHNQLNCYNTAACGASSSEYLMNIAKCGSTSMNGACEK